MISCTQRGCLDHNATSIDVLECFYKAYLYYFTVLLVSDRLRRPALTPLRPLRWQATPRHWTRGLWMLLAKASIKTGTGWHVVPYCPGRSVAWLLS